MTLRAAWRRTGADVPFGDPRGYHGSPMEGHYWRLVDRTGLVVVGICGVVAASRSGLVALASSADGPIGLRETPLPRADPLTLGLDVPGAVTASAGHLRLAVPGGRLELTTRGGAWPRRALGGLGPAHLIPLLSQYWHPHILAGRASGTLVTGGRTTDLDGLLYAEKNWGPAFPERWWWAEAHDAGTTVALAGGELRVGPVVVHATAVAVRRGAALWRVGPPTAVVRARVGGGRLVVTGRGPGVRLEVEAEAGDGPPVPLPVPRRAPGAPLGWVQQHLDGVLRVRLVHRGHVVVDRRLPHAGMEWGPHPGG